MRQRQTDVAIIGTGSAGMRAFNAASEWADDVVIIEGGEYGTTCARVGCMPSKLLVAAAEAAHAANNARHFGVTADAIYVDGNSVMDRVRSERDRFVGFVIDTIETIPESQRIRGSAQFLDNHRIQVGDHTIVDADRIVIATGSSPSYPASFAELGDRLVVNDDIFDWQDLPESVAVFGPGVIGLELGQALSRLGVEVWMFGRGGPVGPLTDPTVMDAAQASFSQDFYLDPDADVREMRRVGDGVSIQFTGKDGTAQRTVVDLVVAATGRLPNVASLNLQNTSLPLDRNGVPVFDSATLQIGDSHVFIAGDVNNERPLLHEAADEGQIAGYNAGRFPELHAGNRRSPLSIVFSDPQIAMVGSRFSELPDSDIVVGEVSFKNQGRSRVMLKNEGLLRIYADARSGRFLGAEMFGPRAEHLGHLLAWAHQMQMTIGQMLDMPYYHPVIEEGLRTALRDAQGQISRRLLQVA